MNTLILNSETANLPIEHLLKQVNTGGVEVRDAQGNVLAFVLSPADHEAWTYAEANLDLNYHQDEVRQALERRGGVTTLQLSANAVMGAEKAAQQ
ncbi:MAG: hypothetical protein WD738_02500 [Pirellulales bacterium]